MTNPYKALPTKAFWRPFVSERSMFDITDLWQPKFEVRSRDKISTYGSCFAQHIGRALHSRGYNWLRTENPPKVLSEENRSLFNYDVFSSRTGNIYTTTLLKQWCEWVISGSHPTEVWEEQGRFYDPFRPIVEPLGFDSVEEVITSRNETIKAFSKSIKECDIFVFTLGLTESWVNSATGVEYPMCPGTAAGRYDPDVHKFVNLDYEKIITSIAHAMEIMRSLNPEIKFILTVSPVPLTATYTSNNVLVATMESKSILRAVAGKLARGSDTVDYFPSYEIINSPTFRGSFFEPNGRNVNPYGVDFVMKNFFNTLNNSQPDNLTEALNEAKCEEEILAVFDEEKK